MIKDSLYQIGPNRYNCILRGEVPMIRVGGGYQRLDQFLKKNHATFEATLMNYQANSGKPIEWIIAQLIKGKKIMNTTGSGGTQ